MAFHEHNSIVLHLDFIGLILSTRDEIAEFANCIDFDEVAVSPPAFEFPI